MKQNLVVAAAGKRPVERDVFHEVLKESSVAQLPMAANVLVLGEEDWRTPIQTCLDGEPLSGGRSDEQKILLRAWNYSLVDGVLYKRGVCEPAL